MKWYGGIGLLLMVFLLGGVVYIGANTDKLGGGFGEPNAISIDRPAPPSSEYITGDVFDLEKYEINLRQELSEAQTVDEVEQIIEETLFELLDDPRLQSECNTVKINFEKEQEAVTKWVESGKDIYTYPSENMVEFVKQWQICVTGSQMGLIELEP